MITPIIMLVLLVAPMLAALLWSSATARAMDYRTPAAAGLALIFAFAGMGHFVQTVSMAQMLPPWVPARVPLVYATGILEFAIAAGFVMPRFRRLSGWVAALVLVGFFPANVYAAINRIPMGGHAWGPVYLWVRAPLQLIILLWVYWFTLRQFNGPGERKTVSAFSVGTTSS